MAGHAAKLVGPMLPLMFSHISRVSRSICKSLPEAWNQQYGSACIRLPAGFGTCKRNVYYIQCSSLHTTKVLAKKGKKKQSNVDLSASADPNIVNLEDVKQDMLKALEILKQDYVKSLSIRTSQGSLDHIQVDTPDGKFPLNHLAQIATKSNNMMVVNMSNFPQATEAAVNAIKQSGMNLNPQVDGHTIQVPVPKVTKEHRENLAKVAKKMCNDTKLNMRNVRQKYINIVKKHTKGTSKDVIFKLEKQIQQILEDNNKSAEEMLAAKTKELLGK